MAEDMKTKNEDYWREKLTPEQYRVLRQQADFEVVAEAGDGEEAVQLVSEYCPDIVIMDIELPSINGIEATKRIKASNPEMSVHQVCI